MFISYFLNIASQENINKKGGQLVSQHLGNLPFRKHVGLYFALFEILIEFLRRNVIM